LASLEISAVSAGFADKGECPFPASLGGKLARFRDEEGSIGAVDLGERGKPVGREVAEAR
jgi:hypothetical protein